MTHTYFGAKLSSGVAHVTRDKGWFNTATLASKVVEVTATDILTARQKVWAKLGFVRRFRNGREEKSLCHDRMRQTH